MKHQLIQGLTTLALMAILSVQAEAQSTASCTHSALVKRGNGAYAITLENSCTAPVKWSYAACAFGQSLESGLVTVGPNQTFQANFDYELLGTPSLKENSCTGTCITELISCSVAQPAPAGPQLKPLSELMIEKPAPETELKPLSELLIEKPVTEPKAGPLDGYASQDPALKPLPKPVLTPVPGATPKIRATSVPGQIGVKPILNPPSQLKPPTGASYAASCIISEPQGFNLFGKGKAKFTNHCPSYQRVAVRVCLPGQGDQLQTLNIAANGNQTMTFDSPEDVTPTFTLRNCVGATCTPANPPACN
ncbi:MAG: hypothetical protein CMK07_05005 [Ponticaulis sp.]|nr:hypothetical protein [Ponticaulis sp.]